MLVEQDECWFSRFAQPAMHAFAKTDEQVRLVQRTPAADETDKALACYGVRCQQTKERYFYFADGQPNSDITILMLKALLAVARKKQKRVLVVVWDRASWHRSRKLKTWIHQHNQNAKRQTDGVRLLTCLLPSKSPWLNPMEPVWMHAKKHVAEFDGELSVDVLKKRLCAHFHTTIEAATLNASA